MDKIVFAIGTNDGENISPTHLGDSQYFYIYTLSATGQNELIDKRENVSPEEIGEHGAATKMKAILKILQDCDVIVGRAMSPNFKNIATKTSFQPVVIKLDEISAIIEKVSQSFEEISACVLERRQGERSGEVLTF